MPVSQPVKSVAKTHVDYVCALRAVLYNRHQCIEWMKEITSVASCFNIFICRVFNNALLISKLSQRGALHFNWRYQKGPICNWLRNPVENYSWLHTHTCCRNGVHLHIVHSIKSLWRLILIDFIVCTCKRHSKHAADFTASFYSKRFPSPLSVCSLQSCWSGWTVSS